MGIHWFCWILVDKAQKCIFVEINYILQKYSSKFSKRLEILKSKCHVISPTHTYTHTHTHTHTHTYTHIHTHTHSCKETFSLQILKICFYYKYQRTYRWFMWWFYGGYVLFIQEVCTCICILYRYKCARVFPYLSSGRYTLKICDAIGRRLSIGGVSTNV